MKAARLVGYGVWFFFAFLVGVYLTFPLDEMKGMITSGLEDQLGKGKQGTYGVDPKVELGSLSLSGFGVKAQRVQVQLASRDPEPGATIDVDELRVGMRPWSLLTKTKTYLCNADLYGGSVDVIASIDDKQNMRDADVSIDDVDLAKVPMIMGWLGVPAGGKIKARAKVDFGTTPEKDAEGDVKLDIKGLAIGAGNLKMLAALGGFEVPLVDLGNLTAEIPVKQGKGTLTNVKLDGKDVQAEVIGDIYVKGKPMLSRLDIDGWFQPMPAFLQREKKFQSLLDLGESLGSMGGGVSLSKAKDEDGHYWFSLKGIAQAPSATLSRDGGKRAKSKGSKPTPNTPPAKETPPDVPDSKG